METARKAEFIQEHASAVGSRRVVSECVKNHKLVLDKRLGRQLKY